MTEQRRVVVTGLGATTPVGGTVTETWEAILAGRSGARTMDYDWVEQYELPVKFAATIHTPPTDVLSKVEVRRLDPSAQYALIASREAWAHAGAPEVDPERLAACMGTGIGGVWTLLSQWDVLKEKGPRRIFPLAVPMLMPNASSAAVSLDLGARAGAHTPVSACASGLEAMGYAAEMIRSGRADIAVAGGTEGAVHALPIAGFAAMQALSTRNDDPERASRPYDTGRDGFVLGEGAGVMVLEEYEHAKARGATIYAELAGLGMSADSHHIAAPEPEGAGASRAMVEAVKNAGLTPRDIVHINAHATSTPLGDIAEGLMIHATLGAAADRVVVTSTKSMTGHLLGAAGAVEAIATILALRDGIVPAIRNLDDPDDDIDLDLVRVDNRPLTSGIALSNSFGFGGHDVCLAFTST
jgi:3-oxoacyl-[acyl-carrier-protein] synthase II